LTEWRGQKRLGLVGEERRRGGGAAEDSSGAGSLISFPPIVTHARCRPPSLGGSTRIVDIQLSHVDSLGIFASLSPSAPHNWLLVRDTLLDLKRVGNVCRSCKLCAQSANCV